MKAKNSYHVIFECEDESVLATVIAAVAPTQGVKLHAVQIFEKKKDEVRESPMRHGRVNGVTSDSRVFDWMKLARGGRATRKEIIHFLISQNYKGSTVSPTVSTLLRSGKIREISPHRYEVIEVTTP